MLQNPGLIVEVFTKALKIAAYFSLEKSEIIHELIRAPHDYPSLPRGMCAVYVFSLRSNTLTPAGPNRVLKVGKVGINSHARFKYQHYKFDSAKSTLAGAIKNNRILWDYIGYDTSSRDLDSWLRANTDRDHFFLSAQRQNILPLLEAYIRGVLGPVYEGSLKGIE